MSMSGGLDAHVSAGTQRVQKRATDPSELELQAAVYENWEPSPQQEQGTFLVAEPSL